MTKSPSDKQANSIVTLRSLTSAPQVESGLESSDPKRKAQEIRYERLVARIAAESDKSGPNVLITVQDKETSLMQSALAEAAQEAQALQTGGLEAQFGEGITGGDIVGWALSLLDHTDPNLKHPIKRPLDDKIGSFADTGRIAIIGDWGTNLYGAPVSAKSIERIGGYEMLMHLGDVYYSGTKSEVKQRFLDPWPTAAGKVNRALNGNHEMYSGGFAYFEDILKEFKQPSSYFAVQNEHWLLVGLDTAHSEHTIDHQQANWLNDVVQKAGSRKVILFSHHQPFSRLDGQGPDLQAALRKLFQAKAIKAWYWGHEHECIIYDRHEASGMLGRCIGHGGIPSPRKSEIRNAPTANTLGGITWKRLSANEHAPASIALDGRNPLVPGEEEKFGPHGYLTLDFNGPNLIERVHLPDGSEIYKAPV